jgi:hypothetical protein
MVTIQLNTVGVVIVILFQFFVSTPSAFFTLSPIALIIQAHQSMTLLTQFQMGLNGIFTGFGLYRQTSTLRLIKQRYPVKFVWTLVSSLSVAGMSLMFDEGFKLPVKNFFALWAVLWYVPRAWKWVCLAA